MSALHYIGKNDTKEQGFMINAHQEQALLVTLLQGRHPDLYQRLYGQRHVRCLATTDPWGLGQKRSNAV